MMERLATHLTSTVAQCNQNPNEWPMLEACLHALKVCNYSLLFIIVIVSRIF